MFRRWAKLIGQPGLADDPRYATDILRGKIGEELSAAMSAWAAGRGRDECLAILIEAGIGCGPVLSPAEVVSGALGLRETFTAETPFPGSSGIPIARPPIRVSSGTVADPRRPPLLGEHSEQVLSEYGFSTAEIAELRDANLIRAAAG